jgi:hypothetical protein
MTIGRSIKRWLPDCEGQHRVSTGSDVLHIPMSVQLIMRLFVRNGQSDVILTPFQLSESGQNMQLYGSMRHTPQANPGHTDLSHCGRKVLEDCIMFLGNKGTNYSAIGCRFEHSMQCYASTCSYRRPFESRNRNLDNSKPIFSLAINRSAKSPTSPTSPTSFLRNRKHVYRQDYRPDHRRQVASLQQTTNTSSTTPH